MTPQAVSGGHWLPSPGCVLAYESSSARYVECPECGTVVRNIDGLHKPSQMVIDALEQLHTAHPSLFDLDEATA